MWFYVENDQQNGPCSEHSIKELIQDGIITADTMLWKKGFESWISAKKTEFSELFSIPQNQAPDLPEYPSCPAPEYNSGNAEFLSGNIIAENPLDLAGKLQKYFTFFLVFMIISAVMGLISAFVLFPGILFASLSNLDQTVNNPTPSILPILGLIPLIFATSTFSILATVFQFMLVYNLWKIIPENEAKTTPVKAIVLLFIPFFNFYWNFIAYHELSKSLDEKVKVRNLPSTGKSANTALAYCITIILSLVVGGFAGFVAFFIHIVMLKKLKDSAVALLHDKNRKEV